MRPPLTEEQKAERDAKKAAIQAQKRPYNKKPAEPIRPAPTPKHMETAPEVKPTEKTDNSSAQEGKVSYSPRAGERIKRSYSNPVVDHTLVTPIPEAPISSAAQSADVHALLSEKQTNGSGGQAQTAPQFVAEQTGADQQKLADTREQAENLVDGGIAAYAQIWNWSGALVKVSERKLSDLHFANKINMNAMFIPAEQDPRRRGQTALEFFTDYNTKVDKCTETTPEFIGTVRPPLIRIAMKHKVGLSDEGTVLLAIGKDALQKGTQLWQLGQIVKGSLQHLEKMHKEQLQFTAEHIEAKAEAMAKEYANNMYTERLAKEQAEKEFAEAQAAKNNEPKGETKKEAPTAQGVGLMLTETEGK